MASFEDRIISTRYVPVSIFLLRKEATLEMRINHSFFALSCALTLGLATGAHAQEPQKATRRPAARHRWPITRASASNPNLAAPAAKTAAPHLLSINQLFHTGVTIDVPAKDVIMTPLDAPQPRSVTAAPIYQSDDGANYYTGVVNDGVDDIYLPAGLTATTGAQLNSFKIGVFNGGVPNSARTVYGKMFIYSSLDQFSSTSPNILVTPTNTAGTPIATVNFQSPTTLAVNASAFLTVPITTTINLTHDLNFGAADGEDGVYGFRFAFYTTSARTTLTNFTSATGGVQVVFNGGPTPDQRPNPYNPQIGFSDDVFWLNYNSATGTQQGKFPFDSGFYFEDATTPADSTGPANFALTLNGTSANNLSFILDGTVTFQGLASSTPSPTMTITLVSTTKPTQAPLVFNFSAFPVSANGTDQTGEFFLYGVTGDTYNVTIASPGYTSTTTNAVNLSTANVWTFATTLVPSAASATGTIALEGVPDLTLTSFNAPLGPYTIEFYTPGTVSFGSGATPVYSQTIATLTATPGSPTGSYTVTGIPFGTYDVVIKAPKNLAVLDPGVAFTAPSGTVIPGVLLPAGDTNNDDSVDSTDFGALIGAFNTDSNATGSGYAVGADLNYDGLVDSTDFGLLIGEFNKTGAK